MKIWHVLENAEEVKTMLDGKKYEMGGVTTHPITFAPHAYIKVERWRDEEGGEVVFIVPMELVNQQSCDDSPDEFWDGEREWSTGEEND